MSTWQCTTTVTRVTGGRPSKFAIMRHNRRLAERQRTLGEYEELKEEARALGYDDTREVVAALCANDEKRPAPRRWWWPLSRVAAALSAAPIQLER